MVNLARKGLPKAIIKKYGISKKAWRVYRRQKSTTPRSRSRSPTSRRTGVRNLVRRRRYRRKRTRRKRTIPILPIVGAGAGFFIPAATSGGGHSPVTALTQARDPNWAVEALIENYTGYNIHTGSWDIQNARGLIPAVVGGVAHKLLNMLGVNRSFANLPSPLNKLRL